MCMKQQGLTFHSWESPKSNRSSLLHLVSLIESPRQQLNTHGQYWGIFLDSLCILGRTLTAQVRQFYFNYVCPCTYVNVYILCHLRQAIIIPHDFLSHHSITLPSSLPLFPHCQTFHLFILIASSFSFCPSNHSYIAISISSPSPWFPLTSCCTFSRATPVNIIKQVFCDSQMLQLLYTFYPIS